MKLPSFLTWRVVHEYCRVVRGRDGQDEGDEDADDDGGQEQGATEAERLTGSYDFNNDEVWHF